MVKLKADVKQVGFRKMASSFAKKLKELEDFEKKRGEFYRKAQQEIGEMYVGAIQERISPGNNGYRTGLLHDSIKYKITNQGISVYSDKTMFKGLDENGKELHYYAPWVEEGTKNVIKPKTVPSFTFYSTLDHGETYHWFKKPWVHGQEGQHYMKLTKENKGLHTKAQMIMLKWAEKCASTTLELESWRNAKGNRRGINFTSAWKKVHGVKSRRR